MLMPKEPSIIAFQTQQYFFPNVAHDSASTPAGG
jgi:hypothetical protein